MNLNQSALKHLDGLIERVPELAGIRESIARVVEAVCECHLQGGKVLVCGNGGSAADSDHIVGELMKGFVLPRHPLPADVKKLEAAGLGELAGKLQRGVRAIALTGHPALSSAILNDTDPYMAFAQQVYVYGKPGDVFIGLSTSGNAGNVVNAAKVGKAFGLVTIGFTGSRSSQLEDICDIVVKVPSVETFRVQEYHQPVYHAICLMVEAQLFSD